MAEQLTDAVLERALRELAQDLQTESPSPGLATAVLTRVAEEPVPSRAGLRIALREAGSRFRARVRWVVGVLLALAFTGLAVSPVGADVAEWFGFHGVLVTEVTEAPTGTPTVPQAEGRLSLDQAAALVDFQPYLPTALGTPDRVAVSADRRLLSMSWGHGAATVRLDQFDAVLSPMFWKTSVDTRLVRVGSGDGLWFPAPHEVVVLGESGEEVRVPARLAAHTLVWPIETRTLRLEGDLTRARALEIADSLR
jgi:hypothetical protein